MEEKNDVTPARIFMSMVTVIVTLSSVVAYLYMDKERSNAAQIKVLQLQIERLEQKNENMSSQIFQIIRTCKGGEVE